MGTTHADRLGIGTMIRPVLLGFVAIAAAITTAAATAAAQEINLDLIDKLETFPSAQQDERTPARPEFLPRPSPGEQKILDELDKRTEVAFRDNELGTALDHLKEHHAIEIWVDATRVNVNDYTVSVESSRLSLRSCLNLILEPHGLCFLVEDDVLKVTTRDAADAKRVTRTYPVGDLFDTPAEAEELTAVLLCGLGLTSEKGAAPPLTISLRTQTLILRQSHQVHDQLLQLLRDLRTPLTPQSHQLVLSFGFERNVDGTKKSEVPVIFMNEYYMDIDQIEPELQREKQSLDDRFGSDAVKSTVVMIRADKDISAVLVQKLIKKCQNVGFGQFQLRPIPDVE